MEDVGAQVASPIFIHQPLAGRFCEPHPMAKKRSLPFQTTGFSQHQQQHRANDWNPNLWNWDSMRFVAKPLEYDAARAGSTTPVTAQAEPLSRAEGQINVANFRKTGKVVENDESLRLKLGGVAGGLPPASEPAVRPSKRVRSGSPGGVSYPTCQVDDCKEDLSNAKDYHRRHKVCEVHSKATKALVGKQMQRFCQQCSRFHPLQEFDEGKRSCRRRLAGHNRRRRKTQPEDATSRALIQGNRENTGSSDLDIINLLAVLARGQGSTDERSPNSSAVTDKEQLMQILSKLNSLPLPAHLVEKLPVSGSSERSISNQVSSQGQNCPKGHKSSPSTMDLLAALSTTPVALATDVREGQSEGSSQGSDSEKSKSACMDQDTCLNLRSGLALELSSSVRGERSSSSNQSPIEDSDSHGQDPHLNLPLQLFSSSPEIDSIPKLSADKKYFSSGSSNPSVDRSPSSSPPVTRKLFPMPTLREMVKPGSNTTNTRDNAYTAPRVSGGIIPLQLFGGSTTVADNGSCQSSAYQAGYTSSSTSDHSPSSLNSDAQDRTGRIIFKLFDKDPSHLPGSLRAQIYNWLSSSPSDMESYIRPGCIVLSLYVSMPSSLWDQLEDNLYHRVKSLISDTNTDFWKNGRFLVHTDKQLASHKGGKIRFCKSWRLWSSPELVSVTPVAVVSGQETSLLLRGRNLTNPGTSISCTHTDTYTVKQVSGSTCQPTMYDEICLDNFRICGTDTSALGRCFIEVENGFRGTSFPVIVANADVCQELSRLELEISGYASVRDSMRANDVQDSWVPTSREETLHFLNELGWLFQRKSKLFLLEAPDYKLCRFKFLLVFSIERDFCALIKTLLDILLEINMARNDLEGKTLEMLSEIQLLNRAVKRRCRDMINLLLHYSVLNYNDTSGKYIFPPNLVGPGGITPLHLAASMSNSEDLVDALTSDPQEIGLHCWSSLLDSNGQSPYAYALRRNNDSYNRLVAQKLAGKENCQVSITIGDEIEPLEMENDQNHRAALGKQGQSSCSKCAIAAARFRTRVPNSQGLLQRPYIHSMLAIAAVCVCVCLLFRGAPDIGSVAPFKWEKLDYGPL